MEDQPTCGKGLAANSALPAKVGESIDAMADVLERHVEALDSRDENAQREREAYVELAADLRRTAAELQATARRMAGYRDLPMGPHDPKALTGRRPIEAFEKFVRVEQELLAMLQKRQDGDRAMLAQMRGAGG